MTNQHFSRVKAATSVLAALLSAVCAIHEVTAAGNGGSPSEPIPSQSVCATGIWVLQQKSGLNKDGNRVFQLFGLPRSKAAEFPISIETDLPTAMLLAGVPVQSGGAKVPTNKTIELEFKPSGAAQIKAKLTFFGESSCSEVVAVGFQ